LLPLSPQRQKQFKQPYANLIGKKANIIFASNVLEHLDSKEQVISAIKKCAENLKLLPVSGFFLGKQSFLILEKIISI